MSSHFNQRFENEACLGQFYYMTADPGAERHLLSVISDLIEHKQTRNMQE
jgi:hypothetical protein